MLKIPDALDRHEGHKWYHCRICGVPFDRVGSTITGNDSGATVTATVDKGYGRLYPEDQVVERNGVYLCLAHDQARYSFKDKDAINADMDEGDRDDG